MPFTPSRLTLARKRRGLTKSQLADMTGLSSRSITAYESGTTRPSPEALACLSEALQFPSDFFSRSEIDQLSPDGASFRALSRMTSSQRDKALGAGELAIELAEWIDKRFRLPSPNFPEELRHQPPAQAASSLRAHWRLGERPIGNMVHLLEANGVRVFSLVEECAEVDAFSLWRKGTPFVFLNTLKSGERGRFDAAHELGHLILHRFGSVGGREAEQEADEFASAFLMPEADVRPFARPILPLDALIQLKKRWGVSVAALAYRLHALGLISDWNYRTLCIEIAQRGFRKAEPEGIRRESSEILKQVFATLAKEGVRKPEVARELGLRPQELEKLVFGLVMTVLTGNGTSLARQDHTGRPRLDVVPPGGTTQK